MRRGCGPPSFPSKPRHKQKTPTDAALQSRDTLRFQHLGESGLPPGASFKAELAQTADQRIRKGEVALPVILSPALTRSDALIEHEAVEHEPGDTIDQNNLSGGWITAEMLNQAVPSGGKEPALSTAIIDGTSTQRPAKWP